MFTEPGCLTKRDCLKQIIAKSWLKRLIGLNRFDMSDGCTWLFRVRVLGVSGSLHDRETTAPLLRTPGVEPPDSTVDRLRPDSELRRLVIASDTLVSVPKCRTHCPKWALHTPRG